MCANGKQIIALFVSSLILLHNTGRAQLNFSLKDNDYYQSPNLSFGGNYIGVDLYTPNLAYFVEGKFCYRFAKEFGWLKGNYAIALGDRVEAITEGGDSQDGIPANGTQALKNVGVSVGINVIKREDLIAAKIKHEGKTTKIVSVPVKISRTYGVHMGYESFRSVLAQGSTTSYTGTVVEASLKDSVLVASNATPMYNAKIASFGIHRQYMFYYVLQAGQGDNRTEYSQKRISTVYADFLFGTDMAVDNVLVPMNSRAPNANPKTNGNGNEAYNYYEVNINHNLRKIPFGARIGWEQITLKPVGLIVGGEIGFRPGIFNPLYNTYLTMKIGFMFNLKAK